MVVAPSGWSSGGGGGNGSGRSIRVTGAAADRAAVGAADGQRGVERRQRRCGTRILERWLEPGTEGRCPRNIVGATGASGTTAVALLFS